MKKQPLSQNFVVVESMEPEKDNKKTLRNKIVIESPELITGKDEMNLIELPFCLVSYRNSSKMKTLENRWIGQNEKGNKKEFYNIITSTDKYGLPTFRGEEVIIAVLGITGQQEFQNPQVHTTKCEMLSLMRWPIQSHYLKLLTETLYQIEGVLIASNHFWDMEEKAYKEKSFHILEGHEFFDTSRRKKGTDPKGYIRWNMDFWEFMQKGFIKPLNTEIYFSLPSNLQRRLYRYADKHIYNGGIEIDLYDLAFNKLAMVGYQRRAEVKRRVQEAVDGLNDRGLARVTITTSKTRSGYKIVIEAPKKSRQHLAEAPDGIRGQGSAEMAPEAKIGASEAISTASATTQLAQMLIERGIRPRAAGELAQKYPARVPIHIQVFDFMISKPDHGIRDPQGFLRKSIEENWFVDPASLPEGFVSKEEQEEQRQKQKQAREDLLAQYQQAAAKIKTEVGEWAELSPEQRISGRLDLWIMEFRRRNGKNPSEDEERRRAEKYIQELPTQEQLLANQLNVLRRQFEQKAQEQGVGDIDLHIT